MLLHNDTAFFYMHIQHVFINENGASMKLLKYFRWIPSTWMMNEVKRSLYKAKKKKNATDEQPDGKISHSFSKSYRETQNGNLRPDTIHP